MWTGQQAQQPQQPNHQQQQVLHYTQGYEAGHENQQRYGQQGNQGVVGHVGQPGQYGQQVQQGQYVQQANGMQSQQRVLGGQSQGVNYSFQNANTLEMAASAPMTDSGVFGAGFGGDNGVGINPGLDGLDAFASQGFKKDTHQSIPASNAGGSGSARGVQGQMQISNSYVNVPLNRIPVKSPAPAPIDPFAPQGAAIVQPMLQPMNTYSTSSGGGGTGYGASGQQAQQGVMVTTQQGAMLGMGQSTLGGYGGQQQAINSSMVPYNPSQSQQQQHPQGGLLIQQGGGQSQALVPY
ncbi:unnamed protein product, partial [Choristocarpus tenellus]